MKPLEGGMGKHVGCRNTGIHHVGLRSANPAASAEFYRDVLGMEIVGGTVPIIRLETARSCVAVLMRNRTR